MTELWQTGDLVWPVSATGDLLTPHPVRVTGTGQHGGRQFYLVEGTTTGYKAEELEPGGLREWALWYAAQGWAIHPLLPGDKTPLLDGWQKKATADPVTIRAWWAKWPAANIGLACGPSGVVAIDLDRHNGRDGIQSWATLGVPGDTLKSKTANGGQHRIYQANGAAITNSAGKLGPGIDVRGDGGYIVLPPSTLAGGRSYAWDGAHPGQRRPAPLPSEVAERLQRPAQAPRQPPSAGHNTPAGGTPYGRKALDLELAQVRQAQEGERNDTLNRAAYNLGQLIGAGELGRAEVEAELQAAADAVGLPEREADKTIKSGLDAGQQDPRQVPDTRHPGRPPGPGLTPTPAASTAPTPGAVASTAAPLLGGYAFTDLGNAERLQARHGDDLLYCARRGEWLVWDGRRWLADDSREVDRRAIDTVRALYAEAAQQQDSGRRAALAGWAIKCEADHKRGAMLHTAGALLPTRPDDLDRDPWLLTCLNGTLDLTTGELLPHQRGDRITKLAPVDYDPTAKAPSWAAFLDRIMAGNAGLITFLQRAIGYSLTGDTREQVLLILHGTGANGKSTLLETLTALLGEYATKTPTETLLLKKMAGGIPADVARLRGARLVTAVEAEEGQRLAESLVKQMTGGDTLAARRLYQDFEEFKPAFKLWLATNHKPQIRGTDLAIWRRLRLVPFTVTIPEAEQDKTLGAKLAAELPGILAWAVRGCLDWQRDGLGTPAEVRQATAAYREEQDTLAGWLDECCILDPTATATAGELYKNYTAWCEANGKRKEEQESSTSFGLRLGDRGFDKYKDKKTKRVVYMGLGLQP